MSDKLAGSAMQISLKSLQNPNFPVIGCSVADSVYSLVCEPCLLVIVMQFFNFFEGSTELRKKKRSLTKKNRMCQLLNLQ